MSARSPILAIALLLAGCYPSNVLEESDRAVVLRAESLEWGPLDPARFPGAWASERIDGEAAGSLLEVRYLFHADRTYTGAGLVVDGANPSYQTLTGTWEIDAGRLILDGALPGVIIESAGDRLRLSSDSGTVVLRRFEPN